MLQPVYMYLVTVSEKVLVDKEDVWLMLGVSDLVLTGSRSAVCVCSCASCCPLQLLRLPCSMSPLGNTYPTGHGLCESIRVQGLGFLDLN